MSRNLITGTHGLEPRLPENVPAALLTLVDRMPFEAGHLSGCLAPETDRTWIGGKPAPQSPRPLPRLASLVCPIAAPGSTQAVCGLKRMQAILRQRARRTLDNMAKVSVPIRMMKKGLGEALWSEKEMLALRWVGETLPLLSRSLTSGAWLGVKR